MVGEDGSVREFTALRAEILVRIALQNATLLLLLPLLGGAIALMIVAPQRAWIAALGYGVLAGAAGLVWIHNAARTTQIKYYMRLVLEPAVAPEAGWERWHARHRVAGVLGSRWRISTIGVFVGSQIAAVVLAALVAGLDRLPAAALLAIVVPGVTALLLVPPRMSAALRERLATTERD